jgi:hypothetical protein
LSGVWPITALSPAAGGINYRKKCIDLRCFSAGLLNASKSTATKSGSIASRGKPQPVAGE